MIYSIVKTLLHIVIDLITNIDVEGLEKFPKTGAFIAAGNHVGRLDAVLVYYFLDRKDVTLIVAKKYKKYAAFRWLAKIFNGVWVDRFNADLRAMRILLRRLKQGSCVVLAPEGTRSSTGKLIQGRHGASYLAAKAGVPIYPVALSGTEDTLVKHRLRHLKKVNVRARIGDAFVLAPLDSKNRQAALENYTDEIMCQIAALLPPSYRGIYNNHPRTNQLIQEPISK